MRSLLNRNISVQSWQDKDGVNPTSVLVGRMIFQARSIDRFALKCIVLNTGITEGGFEHAIHELKAAKLVTTVQANLVWSGPYHKR